MCTRATQFCSSSFSFIYSPQWISTAFSTMSVHLSLAALHHCLTPIILKLMFSQCLFVGLPLTLVSFYNDISTMVHYVYVTHPSNSLDCINLCLHILYWFVQFKVPPSLPCTIQFMHQVIYILKELCFKTPNFILLFGSETSHFTTIGLINFLYILSSEFVLNILEQSNFLFT